jgi:hypothetical protein
VDSEVYLTPRAVKQNSLPSRPAYMAGLLFARIRSGAPEAVFVERFRDAIAESLEYGDALRAAGGALVFV